MVSPTIITRRQRPIRRTAPLKLVGIAEANHVPAMPSGDLRDGRIVDEWP